MTREEKNIALHSKTFDGVVYVGVGKPTYNEFGTFHDSNSYCIRSNSLANHLLAIHAIIHAKLNGFPSPTPNSPILVATFRESGVIFMDTVTCNNYKQYSHISAMEHWIISQLLKRSYGLNPIITVKPVGIILDFEEGGKFYLSDDFNPVHRSCITINYKCDKKVKNLLHAEYIPSTKRTQFVGHKIFETITKEETK